MRFSNCGSKPTRATAEAGTWIEVRVVATPCSQTGITELDHAVPDASRERFDVLGRPVGHNAAPGVYGDQRRWVVVD